MLCTVHLHTGVSWFGLVVEDDFWESVKKKRVLFQVPSYVPSARIFYHHFLTYFGFLYFLMICFGDTLFKDVNPPVFGTDFLGIFLSTTMPDLLLFTRLRMGKSSGILAYAMRI